MVIVVSQLPIPSIEMDDLQDVIYIVFKNLTLLLVNTTRMPTFPFKSDDWPGPSSMSNTNNLNYNNNNGMLSLDSLKIIDPR